MSTEKRFGDVSVVIKDKDVRFYLEDAVCYDENGNEMEQCVCLGDEKDVEKLLKNLLAAMNVRGRL